MHIVPSIFVLVLSQTIIPIHLQELEVRRSRPVQSKCDSSSGCPLKDGYIEETDHSEYNPGTGNERPPVLTRDHYPAPVGVGRPGVGSDYKPIRDARPTTVDDHNPNPVEIDGGYVITPAGGEKEPRSLDDETKLKPVPSGGGYRNIGGGGYNVKPFGSRDEIVKPVRGGNRGGYLSRPDFDRDEFSSKPVRGSEQGHRGHYPKPDVDDYDPRPVRNGGGYRPRPGVDTDEYNPRPGDREYSLRHADYIPRPVGGGGGSYYPDADEYNRKEDDKKDLGGYYKPKDEDYNDGYETRGGVMDDRDIHNGKVIVGKDNQNCICVPYYQCKDGHIVTDGSGIIDARKKPEKDMPLSCGPIHVCCSTPETSTIKPYEHQCGMRNPSGINSRILSPSNKGEADFGEWPWQAAILKAEGHVNIFQCGGVLIDNHHVLTVAHCVFHLNAYNEYSLKVRLGEWDTQTTTEFLAHEDYRVSKIIVHPDFRNTSLWNDLAILRLEEPVLYAPHIGTICLPQHDEVFDGINCVITGWGQDAYKGGTFSNVMKEVSLRVIDNYKCEEMLRKTRLGRFFQLHEGFLCAGGEYGLDSCKGDGGGPLVCVRKDKSYALAGIVSWGIDCGQPSVPGVYVKIQKYLDWISKSTGVSLPEYWPRKP